jgi:putative PIN family toxin of toxin-antitoxin system
VRVVADTNTIVSGLLWEGPPRELIDAARANHITLWSSVALMAELAEVIGREQFTKRIAAARLSATELVEDFSRLTRLVIPAEIEPTVAGDPDDDALLACALAAGAQLVVSGDKRLRNLKSYHGIPIVGASEALAMLARRA